MIASYLTLIAIVLWFLSLAVVLSILLIAVGRFVLFSFPMLYGPVFVPSADDKLRTMLKLAKPKKTDKIIDLGSGDGKIISALAKKGIKSTGVDINPYLVWKSKRKLKQANLDHLAKVKRKNFWDIDFSKYDIIFLYGTTYIMEKLEKKLKKELKPGSKVISNYFEFPHWSPQKTKNQVHVYKK